MNFSSAWLHASMLLSLFFVTQMTLSFLVMEPNPALFFLDATFAYLKTLWGPVRNYL